MCGTAAARAGAKSRCPARTLYDFNRYFVAGYGRGLPPPWLANAFMVRRKVGECQC